jgi:hypothetical protein
MPTYKQNQAELALRPKPLEFPKPLAPILSGPIEIGFTLDVSDSMDRLLDAAAAGYNAFVDEQKILGPARFTFNMFATAVHPVHASLEIENVPAINRTFLSKHMGSTALLDGIGDVIQRVGRRYDELRQHNPRAIIAILTDGMENSSEMFSQADIFQLVHYRRTVHRWEFIFICASEGAQAYGLELGIKKVNIVRFDTDPAGIRLSLQRLSKAISAYRLGDRNFAGYLLHRTTESA